MELTLATLFLLAALILFVLAALPRLKSSVDLIAAGLACATASVLVGGIAF